MNSTKSHDSSSLQICGPQILNFVYAVIHRPQILSLHKILDAKYWHGLKVNEYPHGSRVSLLNVFSYILRGKL